MFMAILFTIIPTFLAYILWSKTKVRIKSNFLGISLFYFTGQYILTLSVFLTALLLSQFTDSLVQKSSFIVVLLMGDILALFYKDTLHALQKLFNFRRLLSFPTLLITTLSLLLSTLLFSPQLLEIDGTIFRSPIYWDFHWHAALVQSFVLGDNFPPQNESFAGVAHAYHYLWAVLVGIYSSHGLGLVHSINLYSIVFFFFILLTLIGLSEEFFKTKVVGILAILLTFTSSSLRFIHYFMQNADQSLLSVLSNIFFNTKHPWEMSYLPNKLYGYNGTQFNLFYFIEERQMIIGVLFLLLSVWVMYARRQFSYTVLFVIGLFMGAFFLWHLHITIMVFLALLFLMIFDKERKRTLFLLGGFFLSLFPHIVFFQSLRHSVWFDPEMQNFPKLNFGFSSQEGKPFSFWHALDWYAYGYGLKLLLLPYSLILLFLKNRKLSLGLFAIIMPSFLVLNSLQLTPATVYENHKFLRPLNMVIDIAVAFGIYFLFFKKRKFVIKILGIFCIVLVTISGIIELMPFLNSKPTEFHARHPSQLEIVLRTYTNPHDVFIGDDADQIHLAGRKLFLGNVLGEGVGLDIEKREVIVDAIYLVDTVSEFCTIGQENAIDYVEYTLGSASPKNLPIFLMPFPNLSVINDKGEQVFFVDVKKGCK